MKTTLFSLRFIVLGILLLGILPSTMYAPAFVKFDGIEGESTDENHKNWINLLSVSSAITRPIASGTGSQRELGNVTFDDVVVVKELDKSTPKLLESCVTGTTIPTATIVLTRQAPTGEQEEYYKIVLTDVLVTSYQTGGSSGDVVPVDTLSLNFGKIEVSVLPLTGEPYPPFRWDVETNSAP